VFRIAGCQSTLPLRRAGPSTYPFAARTRASRQLQKSKVRHYTETQLASSHGIASAVVVVDVFAAASSAHAANVSFGIMDLNVCNCIVRA
jgi:hypothetical protein